MNFKTSLISTIIDQHSELGGNDPAQQLSFGNFSNEIKEAFKDVESKDIARLLFEKTPTLWVSDPAQVKEISQRMGWLSLPDAYTVKANELMDFASAVKDEGFTHVVLLGMGGSSLSSEVARETFGTTNGYPELLVLDNTAPEAIRDIESKVVLDKTLFIVASKSGNTAETLSFFYYFYQQLKDRNIENPGNHFIAITDAGTSLVDLSAKYQFRKVFVNPSDLGGRYSVLSDFGLVPMALMGIDIAAILQSAKAMAEQCKHPQAEFNPGVSLGVMLGECQRFGHDKVTFVLSPSIASFGLWVEQLIAESTGKEGQGLIPINGEEPDKPETYGRDRVFVHMFLDTDHNEPDHQKINSLESVGFPVVRIKLQNKLALGGEYFRWEVATAIAGWIMKINPFDQPNVEESKKNTNQLLEGWVKAGAFNEAVPVIAHEAISVFGNHNMNVISDTSTNAIASVINHFLDMARPGDYVALLPYFMITPSRMKILQDWREQIRHNKKVATTMLNGPRYLHSTGQLHKGGPDTGLFIILMNEESEELPIPNSKYGFAILQEAQALGDFRSLEDKGRRVIRIHLGKDVDEGLKQLKREGHITN